MKRTLGILCGGVWLAALLFTHNAQAAMDLFLNISNPSIPGESQDPTYAKKIDVLAWSFAMDSTNSTANPDTGKVTFRDISITKWVDKASPALMLFCARGEPIGEFTLIVRMAGTTPRDYVKINVKKAVVSKVSTGGSGGDDRLTETVSFSLSAATIEYNYYPAKPDGTADAPIPFTWNVEKNAPN